MKSEPSIYRTPKCLYRPWLKTLGWDLWWDFLLLRKTVDMVTRTGSPGTTRSRLQSQLRPWRAAWEHTCLFPLWPLNFPMWERRDPIPNMISHTPSSFKVFASHPNAKNLRQNRVKSKLSSCWTQQKPPSSPKGFQWKKHTHREKKRGNKAQNFWTLESR